MFDTVLNLVIELVPVLLGQLLRASTEPDLDTTTTDPTSP